MSFASGFAAGSAAVSRGLDLRDLRQQREVEAAERARQEQFRQANASLALEQEVGMQAQADGTGLAMTPVPQQEQYSPQVQAALGLGGPPSEVSAVQPPAPSQAEISSGLAQPPSTAPKVLSTADMFRRQAALLMKYGDPVEAIRVLGLASDEERALGAEQRALSAEERAVQNAAQQRQLIAQQIKVTDYEIEDIEAIRGFDKAYASAQQEAAALGKVLTVGEARNLPEFISLSPKLQRGAIQNLTGFTVAEQELATAEISNLVKGKTLDQILEAHKQNSLLSPGQYYDKVFETDDEGNQNFVGLRMFNDDGTPAGEIQRLGSENAALQFINKASLDPVAGAEFATNLSAAATENQIKLRRLGIDVTANDIKQRQLFVDAVDKAEKDITAKEANGRPITEGQRQQIYSQYLGAAGVNAKASSGMINWDGTFGGTSTTTSATDTDTGTDTDTDTTPNYAGVMGAVEKNKDKKAASLAAKQEKAGLKEAALQKETNDVNTLIEGYERGDFDLEDLKAGRSAVTDSALRRQLNALIQFK